MKNLSDRLDPQRFTYACNVSGDVLLPKHEKAEVHVNKGSPPRISFDIAMENSVTQVNLWTNIKHNAQPTCSQVIITEVDDDNALTDSSVTLNPVSTELNSAIPTPDQEQSEALALAPNPISNVLGQDSGSSGIGPGQIALLHTAGTARPCGRRQKAQAPITTNPSKKYNGFKAPHISDTRATQSKVKPQLVPSTVQDSSAASMELGSTQVAIPPPTPTPVMQNNGVSRCAVPPEELSEEAFLAEPSVDVPPASNDEGSSSSHF